MSDPTPVADAMTPNPGAPSADSAALAKIQQILRQRGLDPTPGPVEDTPSPDEPGHPDYHHRQRVNSALDRLRVAAPKRYREAHADIPEVQQWADQVAANPDAAPSLMLWGPTGTGKTHQAYGAIRRVAEAGVTRFGFFAINMVDLFAALRPGSPDEERARVMRRALESPLLLLDDLGAAKETDWTEEIVYRVINTRYNEELPTIITTNVNPKDLHDQCSDRVASRLVGMCARVHVNGDDRRY